MLCRIMRRDRWTTYRETCGIEGGVILHQVRRNRAGCWLERQVQSNGGIVVAGPSWQISSVDGEMRYRHDMPC